MKSLLALLVLLIAPPAPAAAVDSVDARSAPTIVRPAQSIHWRAGDGSRRYRWGAFGVAITPGSCDPGWKVCGATDQPPIVTITSRGGASVRLKGEPTIGNTLSQGRLSRGGRPAVMLQSWGGGAHCCEHIQLAVPVAGGYRRVDLGEWDGDEIAFPKDVSGDGIADFVSHDDDFLYAFASYAESWAPPQILNIRGTHVVDVSRAPAFHPLFARDLTRSRAACVSADEGRNGACAGYAADAARLGRFAEAWQIVLQHYNRARQSGPRGCGVHPVPATGCPAAQQFDYASYPAALHGFLIERGYLKGRSA